VGAHVVFGVAVPLALVGGVVPQAPGGKDGQESTVNITPDLWGSSGLPHVAEVVLTKKPLLLLSGFHSQLAAAVFHWHMLQGRRQE
jgi:hypothetical protein